MTIAVIIIIYYDRHEVLILIMIYETISMEILMHSIIMYVVCAVLQSPSCPL